MEHVLCQSKENKRLTNGAAGAELYDLGEYGGMS